MGRPKKGQISERMRIAEKLIMEARRPVGIGELSHTLGISRGATKNILIRITSRPSPVEIGIIDGLVVAWPRGLLSEGD